MNPEPQDNPLPPECQSPECQTIDGLLDRFVDGDLDRADRERVQQHVNECDACDATLRGVAQTKQRLNGLPELPCPESVLERVRLETSNLEISALETSAERIATTRPARRLAMGAVAIAASLALFWSAPRPTPQPTPAADSSAVASAPRKEILETQQALARAQTMLRPRAEKVGRETLQRGFVSPAQKVLFVVRDSQLGRWGADAAALIKSLDRSGSNNEI